MKLYENAFYLEDLHYVANLDLPWEKLEKKAIMLSGATGLIGSFLGGVILEKERENGLDCTRYA